MLEMNNTKAILFSLLRAEYPYYSKLVKAVYSFTKFHYTIGEYSDDLISKSVIYLQQKEASTSLIIDGLVTWGMLYFYAKNLRGAKCKLEEAERPCKASQGDKGLQHAHILFWLGEIAIDEKH
jgi:hypothetical protein